MYAPKKVKVKTREESHQCSILRILLALDNIKNHLRKKEKTEELFR